MKEPLEGEIVEEYMLGNTKIKINNACYKNKTQAEIDAIIKRIEDIAVEGLMRKYAKEENRAN
ncbi:hypothetical protein [Alkaliphilus sp. B6464]|uniref:hypothetical protein n=1 Tax=Alkaliphilus sp. B6464 TaxID=2731219 RepID=UPI001BA89D74|nr:hypothetical protein [Alkaliphilus sp. B6464]QUH21461.1 hypothetical protein HYG84_17265 [Alkaliphilus sp. B6464]